MIDRDPHLSMLPPDDARRGCWVVTGDELVTGDLIMFLGSAYRVARFAPYAGIVYTEPGTRDVWVAGDPNPFIIAAPSGLFRILPRAS